MVDDGDGVADVDAAVAIDVAERLEEVEAEVVEGYHVAIHGIVELDADA